jgi:hypothetical protein
MKIVCESVQWDPSCTMRTDRQTGHDEANSRFSQFCEKRRKKKIPNKFTLSLVHSIKRLLTMKLIEIYII